MILQVLLRYGFNNEYIKKGQSMDDDIRCMNDVIRSWLRMEFVIKLLKE